MGCNIDVTLQDFRQEFVWDLKSQFIHFICSPSLSSQSLSNMFDLSKRTPDAFGSAHWSLILPGNMNVFMSLLQSGDFSLNLWCSR